MTSTGTTETSEQIEWDTVTKRSTRRTFFIRAAIDEAGVLDSVPDSAMDVLLTDDDPKLARAEMDEGLAALRRGEDVYFRHVR